MFNYPFTDETSRKLSEMYAEEIKLKQTVMENIAHSVDRDLLMFYSACWVHQPYIDNEARILLEAMLFETGHRQQKRDHFWF